MTSAIAEIFADSCSGKRSEILHRSRIGSGGTDNDRVVHSPFLLKRTDQRGYGRALLSDRYINTVNRVACFVIATLVDNGIDRDGSLTGLAVADNQFTLSASDRYHGIYRLDTRLQRFVDRLTEDHARCFPLQRHLVFLTDDLAFAVDRVTQRVDHTADHIFTYIDRSNAAGTFYGIAFLHLVGRAEQYGTHVILFQVHDDGFHAVVEGQQLVGFGIIQSVDACYPVAYLEHGTHFLQMDAGVDTFQLLE